MELFWHHPHIHIVVQITVSDRSLKESTQELDSEAISQKGEPILSLRIYQHTFYVLKLR